MRPSIATTTVVCILCGNGGVDIKEQINFSDLRDIYLRSLQIDIQECFTGPFHEQFLPLYACSNCAIEFFPPELAGNAFLYEQLSKHDWYYGKYKWEFLEAARCLSSVGSLVEVGCGEGHFLELMKKKSQTHVVGLEPNKDAVARGLQKGLDIRDQTIELFAAEPNHVNAFDAICSFQVLEHVPDPKSFIESSLHCLKRNGLLFISVPNRSGFMQYVENDILNMPPHHIARWNRAVMEYICRYYNLQIVSYKEEPVAEYHKSSYRTTMLKKYISTIMGSKQGTVVYTSTIPHKVVSLLSLAIEAIIPHRFWKYTNFAGHTFCVTLQKL